jgi:hypothetical protein
MRAAIAQQLQLLLLVAFTLRHETPLAKTF